MSCTTFNFISAVRFHEDGFSIPQNDSFHGSTPCGYYKVLLSILLSNRSNGILAILVPKDLFSTTFIAKEKAHNLHKKQMSAGAS